MAYPVDRRRAARDIRDVLPFVLCSAYCGHFLADPFMSGRFLPRLHLKAENNFNCSVLLTSWLATVTTRSLPLAISYAQLFHGLVFAHVAYQFDEKVEDFTDITGPSG